jgi:hypothetical protein
MPVDLDDLSRTMATMSKKDARALYVKHSKASHSDLQNDPAIAEDFKAVSHAYERASLVNGWNKFATPGKQTEFLRKNASEARWFQSTFPERFDALYWGT